MSCIDDSHYEHCGLCAKFRCREVIRRTDFEELAEDLAAACPYYHLQQSLVKLLLEPNPGRLRREISWNPIPCSQSGYMAEPGPLDYATEYWDVYLEPSGYSSRLDVYFSDADGKHRFCSSAWI